MDPFINQTAWSILVVISALVIGGCLFLVWKFAAPPPEAPVTPAGAGGRRRTQNDEAVSFFPIFSQV